MGREGLNGGQEGGAALLVGGAVDGAEVWDGLLPLVAVVDFFGLGILGVGFEIRWVVF